MTIRSRTLVIATLLAATPAHAQGAMERCRVTAEPARRVELPDGRIVSTDVQSLARRGDTVMAIGRYAYVFAASSPRNPTMQDSIIGFATTGAGKASLVPSPMRSAVFPKVAAGPDAFEFVFATGADTTELRTGVVDTATIWYAQFTNGRWSSPERVAVVRNAGLQHETTSDLLVGRGAVSFAYVIREPESSRGGVVLLRRQRGRWSADTLRMPTTTSVVRLLHSSSDESLLVLLMQMGPLEAENRAPRLHLARFNSSWTDPQQIAGDGARAVATPLIATLGDDTIVSWNSWESLQQATSQIEWLRLGVDGRIVTGPVVARGGATYPFEMVVVNNHPLWLYRGHPFGETVALASATDSVMQLGAIRSPFENPRAMTIALDQDRALVFTMKQGREPNEPMIASWTTTLEFRCPRSAQR